METLKWSTQKRKVNDLIPYEHNPQKVEKEKGKVEFSGSTKEGIKKVLS